MSREATKDQITIEHKPISKSSSLRSDTGPWFQKAISLNYNLKRGELTGTHELLRLRMIETDKEKIFNMVDNSTSSIYVFIMRNKAIFFSLMMLISLGLIYFYFLIALCIWAGLFVLMILRHEIQRLLYGRYKILVEEFEYQLNEGPRKLDLLRIKLNLNTFSTTFREINLQIKIYQIPYSNFTTYCNESAKSSRKGILSNSQSNMGTPKYFVNGALRASLIPILKHPSSHSTQINTARKKSVRLLLNPEIHYYAKTEDEYPSTQPKESHPELFRRGKKRGSIITTDLVDLAAMVNRTADCKILQVENVNAVNPSKAEAEAVKAHPEIIADNKAPYSDPGEFNLMDSSIMETNLALEMKELNDQENQQNRRTLRQDLRYPEIRLNLITESIYEVDEEHEDQSKTDSLRSRIKESEISLNMPHPEDAVFSEEEHRKPQEFHNTLMMKSRLDVNAIDMASEYSNLKSSEESNAFQDLEYAGFSYKHGSVRCFDSQIDSKIFCNNDSRRDCDFDSGVLIKAIDKKLSAKKYTIDEDKEYYILEEMKKNTFVKPPKSRNVSRKGSIEADLMDASPNLRDLASHKMALTKEMKVKTIQSFSGDP